MSIFMQVTGITGEAADAPRQGWLDVENFRWSVSRQITAHTSTRNDRESSNARISDLQLLRRMDSATPALFIESCCGRGKDIVIQLTKTGAGHGADVFLEYTLKNALISGYEVDVHTQDDRRPLEMITISFVDMELRYTPYDDAGNALPPIAVGFDTATNTRR